jgi:hypothetical protein
MGQSLGQICWSDINKVVGVVVAGCRVGDAASVFNNLVKLAGGEAIAALKNHVLQEVCQPRPGFGDRPSFDPGIDHHGRAHNLLVNHGQPIGQLTAVCPQSCRVGSFRSEECNQLPKLNAPIRFH